MFSTVCYCTGYLSGVPNLNTVRTVSPKNTEFPYIDPTSIPGYKINLGKGIDIYSSLDTTVKKAQIKLSKSTTEDLDRWSNLSIANQSSIVKMNLFLRVIFYSIFF